MQREVVLSSLTKVKDAVCDEPDYAPPDLGDWTTYVDDVSGKALPSSGVEKATREELDILEGMQWLERVGRDALDSNVKIITTRWVDINKGDTERPNYRSRLVARELKMGSSAGPEYFAATPPPDSFRLLVSLRATNIYWNKKSVCVYLFLMFLARIFGPKHLVKFKYNYLKKIHCTKRM